MGINGQSLVQGQTVTFEPGWDAMKNKAIAQKVNCGTPGHPAGSPPAVRLPGVVAPPAAAPEPNDNLFIAGLPLHMTDDQVKQIFGAYGCVVSCKVLPASGKPDVAALVRMADPDQAKWLVDNVNQNIPLGLGGPVTVRFAKTNTEKAMAPSFGQAPAAPAGRYSPYSGASLPDSWKTLMAPAAPAPAVQPL